MSYGYWDSILTHAIVGLVLTGIFWGICAGVSEGVSGGILAVPVVFLIVFLTTAWFFGKYRQPSVICPKEDDTCAKKQKVRAILVPRTDGCPPPFPKGLSKTSDSCPIGLKKNAGT